MAELGTSKLKHLATLNGHCRLEIKDTQPFPTLEVEFVINSQSLLKLTGRTGLMCKGNSNNFMLPLLSVKYEGCVSILNLNFPLMLEP